MEHEIPTNLIETLLSLGTEAKEKIKQEGELIDFLKGFEKYCRDSGHDDWQTACDSLSRESHVLLFRGLVYADILAWGPNPVTPVNVVFSKLNTRCWPDTVFSLIRWAVNVCEYHKFDTRDYAFARMLENR
jgi:hypothetical protein